MTKSRTPEQVASLLSELIPDGPDAWETVQDEGRAIVLRAGGLIAKCAIERKTYECELQGLEYVMRYCPSLGPALVASFDEQAIVVMEDLGSGPSLADALLAVDTKEVHRALDEYIDALAALHEQSVGQARASKPRWLSELTTRARTALGEDVPPGLIEISSIGKAEFDQALLTIFEPGSRAVLSFGDMCPDNNVRISGGIRFFDLEAAGFVDPALDVANLVMPFPTCWCCYDIPEPVRTAAVERYLSHRTDESLPGLSSAIAVFTVMTLALTAVRVAEIDDHDELDGLVLPTGRQRVIHRLGRAQELLQSTEEYPALREWFAVSLDNLRLLWPETEPLDIAPAFRSPSQGL